MSITVGSVLKYSCLPGIIPRTAQFFGSGFGHVALYMAFIYRSINLLPDTHPYLKAENIGRFGVKHVIAEAGNNLKFDKNHLDQIAIYFLLLAGIVILLLQFFLLLLGILMPQAFAGSLGYLGNFTGLAGFFQTPPPVAARSANDIAFLLLDYVFGLPPVTPGPTASFFNSCLGQAPGNCLNHAAIAFPTAPTPIPFPSGMHQGLHLLVEFYNTGILVVGLLILMYFVVVTTVETAATGTPFGRRFNRLWVVLRLIFAVALLVPIHNGFNTAQVMTLRIAKWGSSFATNAWDGFLTDLTAGWITPLGDPANLVATPNVPELNTLLEFIFTARTCLHIEAEMRGRDIGVYIVRSSQEAEAIDGNTFIGDPLAPPAPVNQLFVNNGAAGSGITYANALAFSNNKDFTIYFGELDPAVGVGALSTADPIYYKEFMGFVRPICGALTINIENVDEPGPMAVQEAYFDMIKVLWTDGNIDLLGSNLALWHLPIGNKDPGVALPDRVFVDNLMTTFAAQAGGAVAAGVAAEIGSVNWTSGLGQLGWGGAALWYNKVAELNGSIYSAIQGLPLPKLYPEIMEYVKRQRMQTNNSIDPLTQYSPYFQGTNSIDFRTPEEEYMAIALYAAYITFYDGTEETWTSNPLLNGIKALFGLDGLYSMAANPTVHPLAQIVGIGKSLVESSVVMLGATVGSSILSRVFSKVPEIEGITQMAAQSLGGIAKIGLMLGFVLYYVVPFMPFIYFFFAVGGWVKGIFEAIVGMPLFALAHVRIDGNGLPGPAAMNGYFLLLEILLRPILIIFGLLAAISIFAAQVNVLHDIWWIVVSNVAGFDNTAAPAAGIGSMDFYVNAISHFFFTVMYAIIVYLIGVSCFKLIDLIPNYILRWLNAGVSTFGEKTQDPADNLVRNMFFGGQMLVSQGNGAMLGLLGRNG
jgi:hypothetical protein